MTNYKKTIPQSILKLPRDKKSNYEPKNEARDADLQPNVDSKRETIHFKLRTTDRAGAVGKGRVGVNPYPGTGIGVCSWGSTRSEAKGLGGFFCCWP